MARPSRFSPRSEPSEALEQRTVCREELCASLVRGISDAVRTGQARFDLVLGPRGAGKSHLLGLVEGRLRKELEGRAVIAGLPEEFHPSSLVHLLAEILRSLPPDPIAGPVEQQLAILAATSPEDARDRAVGMIGARLQELPLIVVIENLDVVLAAIGRDGQHQLRSILQTERRWSSVASSRSRAPSFFKESEPFFGTFVLWPLEPLSAEGCRELLVRLAQTCERDELARELGTPKGRARVQTLRHVLGGYPRAMAFIFPHLHHDRPDAVEQALRDLAEELTPYFQEQMSRLPPGQRPIAELLAERWTPLSVGEIASATFNSQPTVSTYLRRLRDDAIVRSIKLGREHFYEIADPLFRIARAMKRNELRANTFLRVLQGWYELRGLDVWRLPPTTRAEICALVDVDDGDYDSALFDSLWQELERGDIARCLARARALDLHHPLRAAFHVIALGLLGQDEEAFSELRAVGSSRVLAVLAEVASLQEELSSEDTPLRLRALAEASMVGRFCGAALSTLEALDDEHAAAISPEASEILLRPLRSKSSRIRRAATELLVELMLPFALANAGRYELCGSIVELLEPIGAEALSFNLAMIALHAWANDKLFEVFGQPPHLLWRSSQGLGPFVKLVIALVAFDGDAPRDITVEALTNYTEALAAGEIDPGKYSPADWVWWAVLGVTLVRHSSTRQWMSREESFRSEADRLWLASALHAGILYWIAAGRDLTPIAPAISLEQMLTAGESSEPTFVGSSNPDASYVRLAAPERATVRELAKSLGLEARYAALCALSNDDA